MTHRMGWVARLSKWLRGRQESVPERQRARDLIDAVDAGGMPLNPARVNDIARNLGLDVSRHAPIEATISRIRRALENGGDPKG